MSDLLPRLVALALMLPGAVLIFGWLDALVVWAPLALVCGYGVSWWSAHRARLRHAKALRRIEALEVDLGIVEGSRGIPDLRLANEILRHMYVRRVRFDDSYPSAPET